jgi:hypothetical protein
VRSLCSGKETSADVGTRVTFPCCIDVADAAEVLSRSFLKVRSEVKVRGALNTDEC